MAFLWDFHASPLRGYQRGILFEKQMIDFSFQANQIVFASLIILMTDRAKSFQVDTVWHIFNRFLRLVLLNQYMHRLVVLLRLWDELCVHLFRFSLPNSC